MNSKSPLTAADGAGAGAASLIAPAAEERPQSRLHNFSFPSLSWGNHRLLRCVKFGDGIGKKTSSSSSSPENSVKPWNLRTRRAACHAPLKNNPASNPSPSPSPSPLRFRSGKGERRKFAIALSLKEIEEDFFVFKGTKLPRRPKKRPRTVQRQLDSIFPGFNLTEVTLDRYKVEEER